MSRAIAVQAANGPTHARCLHLLREAADVARTAVVHRDELVVAAFRAGVPLARIAQAAGRRVSDVMRTIDAEEATDRDRGDA